MHFKNLNLFDIYREGGGVFSYSLLGGVSHSVVTLSETQDSIGVSSQVAEIKPM